MTNVNLALLFEANASIKLENRFLKLLMAGFVLPTKTDFTEPRQAWPCRFNQPASRPCERMITGLLVYQEQWGITLKDAPGSNPSSAPS